MERQFSDQTQGQTALYRVKEAAMLENLHETAAFYKSEGSQAKKDSAQELNVDI